MVDYADTTVPMDVSTGIRMIKIVMEDNTVVGTVTIIIPVKDRDAFPSKANLLYKWVAVIF